jgi:hypothetical protein
MITVGDIIRVVFTYLMTGDDVAQNIFHFIVDSGTENDLAAFAGDVEQWLVDAISGNTGSISDELDLNRADIYKYNSGTGQFDLIIDAVYNNTLGSSVAEMMPHGVCYLLQRLTENPRSTAQCFFPGVPENGVADGLITASTLPTLIQIADGLTDNLVTTSAAVLIPGTFSRATATFNKVIGIVGVPQEPAYQRRRKPGVGL